MSCPVTVKPPGDNRIHFEDNDVLTAKYDTFYFGDMGLDQMFFGYSDAI